MEKELITNNDSIIVPDGIETTIPLTPDVPLDVETTINELPEEVDKIGNFFGTIQESVTIAWRYHLKTHKHFIHMATQDYYYKALNLVDKIIEEYQGDSGVTVENYVNCIFDGGKSEVDYFTELKEFVTIAKTETPWKEEIISDIDDLLGAIDSTLYQLTSFTESAIKSFDEFCFEDYEVIGVEGGVDGVFDTVTKSTGSQDGAGAELGAEGGVEGAFDNITKTTKENVAPVSDKKDKSQKCKDKDCDSSDDEEEE